MTTDANHFSVVGNEEGQSVFEFLLMLPVMIGLVVVLVEVNTTIQVSIVDQQYARADATFLAFNSPIYPQADLRSTELDHKGYNQMVIGVMDKTLADGVSVANPIATTQLITRTLAAQQGSNDARAEPNERSLVRVRDTVSLCTQSEVIMAGGQVTPVLDPMSTSGTYALPDNTPIDWQFCRSAVQMLAGG